MIAQPRQADAILVLGDILSEDHTFTISLAEELFFEPPFAPPVARVATVAGIDLPGLDFDDYRSV